MNHSRRQCIEMMLAAGFWTVGGVAFADHTEYASGSETTAMLASILGNEESAKTVGREYLRANPDDADRALLEGILSDSKARDGYCFDQPGLRAAIQSRVRSDYEIGQVVTIHGWILSRTEARLCALVSLSSP